MQLRKNHVGLPKKGFLVQKNWWGISISGTYCGIMPKLNYVYVVVKTEIKKIHFYFPRKLKSILAVSQSTYLLFTYIVLKSSSLERSVLKNKRIVTIFV